MNIIEAKTKEDIKEDGFYNMSDELYFSLPYESNSRLKSMLEDRKKYYQIKNEGFKDSKSMFVGRAFHSYILENDKFDENYIVVDLSSRNTKKYKELKESESRVILLQKEFEELEKLKNGLYDNTHIEELLKDSRGVNEIAMIFTYKGIKFKSKIDRLFFDKKTLIDLKTTNEPLDNFFSKIKDFNSNWYNAKNDLAYDMQLALYSIGHEILTGNFPSFIFCVVNTSYYSSKLFYTDESIFENGKMKLDYCINKLNDKDSETEILSFEKNMEL